MTDADEDGGRPRYVAIITDGNGRWATARDLPVVAGHEAGADDEHRAEIELQKLTDTKISELDGHLKGKEAEILEV